MIGSEVEDIETTKDHNAKIEQLPAPETEAENTEVVESQVETNKRKGSFGMTKSEFEFEYELEDEFEDVILGLAQSDRKVSILSRSHCQHQC